MGLDFYTHFTSPIRRYADNLVHRQLWKAINNIPLNKIDVRTIFMMNFCEKYYKKVQKHERLIKCIQNLFPQTVIERDAYIIGIKENSVNVYICDLFMDCIIRLINEKIEHIIEKKNSSREISMTNKHTGQNISIKLFDKIRVKISFVRKYMKRIEIVLVSPNISLLFTDQLDI